MKLKILMIGCLMLGIMTGIAAADQDGKILLNGQDVTAQYAEGLKGNLNIYTTSPEWGEIAIDRYLPEVMEGASIRAYNINGRIGCSYCLTTRASTGEEKALDVTGINTNIEAVEQTDEGVRVSTSGHGVGQLTLTNFPGYFYQIKEGEEVVASGPVVNGKISYQFTQSEHTFTISNSMPEEMPEQEEQSGRIIVNGEDVTEQYTDEQFTGTLFVRTDRPAMVKYWVAKYLPQLEDGYDVTFTFINSKMTVSYKLTTTATAVSN